MPEPHPDSPPPPGAPPPPAPPATGGPHDHPDPRDPGPPITVRLGEVLLGDLGAAPVDARVLSAILLRAGPVAGWLQEQGLTVADVEAAFPGARWPG